MKISIISGANLNIIERRGDAYGRITYEQFKEKITGFAKKLGVNAEFFISNFEGELIEYIQNDSAEAVIINGGAFSHYSLAIADALQSLMVPKIEVHLTNIHKSGRHQSVTGAACDGVISGFGVDGYRLAMELIIN